MSTDRRRRTAAAAAGDAVEVPRIARAAPRGVFRGGTHGKFVHVRAPHQDGAGLAELRDDGGVVRRDITGENFRRAGTGIALDIENVLDRDRDAAEGKGDVGLIRSCAGLVGIEMVVGLELGVDGFDACGQLVDDGAGSEGAGLELLAEFGNSEAGDVHKK